MQYRRIVCLLLGLWLGGGLLMAWFGATSFGTARSVMNSSNPGFAIQTKPLGTAVKRSVLRYEIAELNESLFQAWETMQLILGLFFFAYILFGTLEGKFVLTLALLMVVATGIQRFGLSPELGNLGKALDYMPSDVAAGERARFWLLHGGYLGCEAIKAGLGAVILASALRHGRSVDPVNQFDLVNKANHGHINW